LVWGGGGGGEGEVLGPNGGGRPRDQKTFLAKWGEQSIWTREATSSKTAKGA